MSKKDLVLEYLKLNPHLSDLELSRQILKEDKLNLKLNTIRGYLAELRNQHGIEKEEEIEARDIVKEFEEKRSQNSLKQLNNSLVKEVQSLRNKLEYYELPARDIKPITPHKSKQRHEATVLSLLSDIHCEEKIDKIGTNGINEFNLKVCEQRVRNYFINLLKLVENNRNDVSIDNLVIGLLGDNLHGYIHDEYLSTNYLTPPEATMFIQTQIESGLRYLSGKFKRIVIICKVGNHSRTTDKIHGTTELRSSYEYILYKQLERLFPEIEFIIEENYISYFDIYDKRISFEHGHAFRYGGGIGGIYPSLIRHVIRQHNIKRYDLACMGHWHSLIHLPNVLINGSVCGYNDYARRKGFNPEPPSQQFLLIDKDRGFTVNAPIFI
jgi:hypothetical protein